MEGTPTAALPVCAAGAVDLGKSGKRECVDDSRLYPGPSRTYLAWPVGRSCSARCRAASTSRRVPRGAQALPRSP